MKFKYSGLLFLLLISVSSVFGEMVTTTLKDTATKISCVEEVGDVSEGGNVNKQTANEARYNEEWEKISDKYDEVKRVLSLLPLEFQSEFKQKLKELEKKVIDLEIGMMRETIDKNFRMMEEMGVKNFVNHTYDLWASSGNVYRDAKEEKKMKKAANEYLEHLLANGEKGRNEAFNNNLENLKFCLKNNKEFRDSLLSRHFSDNFHEELGSIFVDILKKLEELEKSNKVEAQELLPDKKIDNT
ncbi:MAG: hypothetical protein CfP315_0896 [Candidatus Improbicoccus pseudotrichonymphae]|uniref:Uncharacterized protein n=1 Tax=Candidatus Improbicoccus pseudotrichonymphae TaxID=3033792 RepID=A0AA48I1Y4_9FIRM|nr:MAG: hypothetical protein CfP315_0896 [Candidatus Improbicoccus pseudotrichonymphae]